MAERIPARIRWAVERLRLAPAARVLEIGCGAGVALSRVAERLPAGHVVGLDRSAAMLARAAARNEPHLASGRVALVPGALADVRFEPGGFDTVFAVNVNLFWRGVTTEPDRVREALAPGGALHLFYGPPSPARAGEILERAGEVLRAHRFAVAGSGAEPLGPGVVGGWIVARPEPGAGSSADPRRRVAAT